MGSGDKDLSVETKGGSWIRGVCSVGVALSIETAKRGCKSSGMGFADKDLSVETKGGGWVCSVEDGSQSIEFGFSS